VDHYTVDLFSISGPFFRGRFFRGPYFLNSVGGWPLSYDERRCCANCPCNQFPRRHQRYRQTDGLTDDIWSQYRTLHYSTSRGKNVIPVFRHFPDLFVHTFDRGYKQTIMNLSKTKKTW